jgi:hypothetical protein
MIIAGGGAAPIGTKSAHRQGAVFELKQLLRNKGRGQSSRPPAFLFFAAEQALDKR